MGWILKFLAFIGVVLGLIVFAARFQDGPLGPIAGGPLESGPKVGSKRVDFSFAKNIGEIELQLLEPPRSRTTWVIYYEGSLFVPAGFMNLPIWKQWPHEAMVDGRAIARIQGKRYPFQMERVTDVRLWEQIGALTTQKYDLPKPDSRPGGRDLFWVFRLSPRS